MRRCHQEEARSARRLAVMEALSSDAACCSEAAATDAPWSTDVRKEAATPPCGTSAGGAAEGGGSEGGLHAATNQYATSIAIANPVLAKK
mmetsp:Transcript_86236/g.157302  ORF Transcript_86236/g.157302 Transcript_86236/m.157302 type:complete len:90 (+) Transcript_86236:3-272(+)